MYFAIELISTGIYVILYNNLVDKHSEQEAASNTDSTFIEAYIDR